MQTLNVHFVNRGYGTDDGYKAVDLKDLTVCEFTGAPSATIANPYFQVTHWLPSSKPTNGYVI